VKAKSQASGEVVTWRRRSFEVQRSEVVARRGVGPEPPRAWASRLRRLIDASRQTEEGPPWWTPVNAYFGNVETRTDPQSYYWDGMQRIGRRDPPLAFFQFTFAGFGQFELYSRPPQRIVPGMGFFALLPSRHRYYLPEGSPGWTFAWIGIYHPYLLRRIKKQVAAAGPVVRAAPNSGLVSRMMRLVEGAFRKDFRDRFEVEEQLFAFMLAYERLAESAQGPEGELLLDALRARVLEDLRRPVSVEEIARERGMSRSAFSHHFHALTGLTPARFMTEVRIQEAAHLLTKTRAPLAEVARDCGFADANHFGKVFRRFRAQTPGAYRRLLT
jgi:AraC-like DNA-binding protein